MADRPRERSSFAGESDRLSALDAAFLFLERSNQRMYIGCIAELERAIGLDELLDVLGERLVPLERFRQRPARARFDLAWPTWEDDPSFDLRRHVRHVALPPPGDEQALRHVVETLFSAPLLPDRPLWEVHLIDGLARGRAALLFKVHHCVNDGISGFKVLEQIADREPSDEGAGASSAGAPAAGVRRGRDEREGRGEAAPTVATGTGPGASGSSGLVARLRSVIDALRTPEAILDRVREATEAVEMILSFVQQPSSEVPFNGRLGHSRRMVWTSFPLDEFVSLRAAADCTINDAVLAVVTGALRSYLDGEGVSPELLRLRALVPVNVRADGHGPALGNLITGMFPRLPVKVADPLARLRGVRDEMLELKNRGQARAAGLVLALAGALPAVAESTLLRFVPESPLVNTICTNLRGPAEPLFLCGRRILEIHPIVNLFQSVGLGFAVASYAGRISICAATDPSLVPDADRVIRAVERTLYETRSALWGRSRALALAARLAAEPKVADMMTREVVTIGKGDSLLRAREIMRERRVRHIPVVDDRFRLVRILTQRELMAAAPGGALTEEDLLRAVAECEAARSKRRKLTVAAPHETAFEAGRRMIEHNLDCLPVLDDKGRLVGMVTEENFLRWTTEQMAGLSGREQGRLSRP